jgi:hypothetical protein
MLNHALAKVMRNFPVAARRHGLWYALLGSLLWMAVFPAALQAQSTSGASASTASEKYWSVRWPQLRKTLEARNPNYGRWKREREKQMTSGKPLAPSAGRKSLFKYKQLREVIDRRDSYKRWQEREAELNTETKAGSTLQPAPSFQRDGLNYRGLRQVVLRYQKIKLPVSRTSMRTVYSQKADR